MKYFDFHIHTTLSDGQETAEDIIAAAQETGLKALAFTDHNRFVTMQPYQRGDLEIIPGCEFSTIYDCAEGRREVHVIGLFPEGVDEQVLSLFELMDEMAYPKAIIRKLQSLGLDIRLEEVLERYPGRSYIGRTMIANVLVEKGYAKDNTDAFDSWIGNYSPYYVNPLECVSYASLKDCVQTISDHKGLAILAHPYHYRISMDAQEELIAYFRNITDQPLGMEVYYNKYMNDLTKMNWLEEMARRYHLLPSAGSDRHRKGTPFANGDYSLWEDMKKAL